MTPFVERIRARARERVRTIAFPEAHDERVVLAALQLARDRLARPLLLGDADAIRERLRLHGGGEEVGVVDPRSDGRRDALAALLFRLPRGGAASVEDAGQRVLDPLLYGALLLAAGAADGLVAGAATATADVLRAGLKCVEKVPGVRTVSSSFYMVVRDFRGRGEEVLTFTDAGVVPDPRAEELVDIAAAAADSRRAIVGDEPVVAFLSYSTHGSAGGRSVEKVREALALFREARPDVAADGELQADAALVPDVARRKVPGSAVAGSANVLVFPDLDAGNIAYKLVQRLAGAEAYGPIVQGFARPINDLSRGASVGDIVNVACITALQA